MKVYKVRILPSAYQDIAIAKAWYKKHNESLPGKFIEQINLTITSISDNPFAFAIRYKEIHIANTNRFPYAIHYFINNDIVEIIGVFHTAISPDKWPKL